MKLVIEVPAEVVDTIDRKISAHRGKVVGLRHLRRLIKETILRCVLDDDTLDTAVQETLDLEM